MAKKPLADLRHGVTVGVETIVGRDEYGMEILQKMPTRYSLRMLDMDGNEPLCPMLPGRTVEPEAIERYLPRLKRELVKGGNVPALDCPHSLKYQELLRGPMAAIPKDTSAKQRQEIQSCEGGKPCEKGANGAVLWEWNPNPKNLHDSKEVWVKPCKHYIALRKLRREMAKTKRDRRKQVLLKTPRAQMENLVQSFAKMAQNGVSVQDSRRRLQKGSEQPVEEKQQV